MNPSTELRKFGISDAVTRSFTSASAPELVEYLDLLPSSVSKNPGLPLDGAVEHNQRAVLFYVSEGRLSAAPNERDEELQRLNRSIASRGDCAHLAIVKPGRLEVTPVRLGDVKPSWKKFDAKSHEAINFYSNLVHGKIPGQETVDSNLVFDEMYNLLTTGADAIRHKIGRDNVLSLVGRALFFRFLYDRRVVTEDNCPEICATANELKACFDNSENAYRTSKWLDDTFNGNFLPFRERGTRQFFDDLNRSAIVFSNLKAIVRGLQPVGENQYQHRFDWAAFDFAHVPVGLLSQVYEAFSWKWDPHNAEDTSVHYTPRNIAVTLAEEAFAALSDPHQARVLDPACGAGVFLVLAFRRLYAEHWRKHGVRPETAAIRKILETQLCGFDISESALRLAALSLYLTAIELDPNPVPPEKLKFKDLDKLVLFNQRTNSDPQDGPVVGSIRAEIGDEFSGRFDLILCNPPWSRIEDESVVKAFDSASREIVSAKDEDLGTDYQNPRGEPDLPFVWKATHWCQPGGQIAMVLPARILFRQGEIATRARTALFRLIHFTGIVNCSNVRKTNVWPDMDQPFMLVFARNEKPADDSRMWFVSPQADFSMNRLGEVRIDAHSATVLAADDIVQESWILKALAVGSDLDIGVIRKIKASKGTPLGKYWEKDLGLTSRQGYSVEGSPQKDASLMRSLIDAGKANELPTKYSIDPKKCKAFSHNTLRRRLYVKGKDPLRVYRGPILLLRQSLPEDRSNGNALSCGVDIAFNKSFYGYSAKGHPNAATLIQYIHILSHTNLWLHYALCTSAKLAFERTYYYKEDLDDFPVIPLENLTTQQQGEIRSLALRLESEESGVFKEIDTFFAKLYKLTARDLDVVDDTVTVRNPHDELGLRGSTGPTTNEVGHFCSLLKSAIQPFAKKAGFEVKVDEMVGQNESDAFRFLRVSSGDAQSVHNVQKLILQLAERTGASLVMHQQDHDLLVGILNQFRYWTSSRARLLAADILRDYFSTFER